ncbi:hypothetical protein B9T21_08830 [Wohlfahrtiimonas chitiniclastica]|nr:hypothetical protein B9T21_08830 [Wohlfahrtiimonas chitiniclastica]
MFNFFLVGVIQYKLENISTAINDQTVYSDFSIDRANGKKSYKFCAFSIQIPQHSPQKNRDYFLVKQWVKLE